MKSAPLPENESARIEALRRYSILDTLTEEHYQEIVTLASTICHTDIALVSLVDSDRQWFKAKVGLDASETPRDLAFCAHAILGEDIFEVPDALDDDRFYDNPLVSDGPKIRFYAGAPLRTGDGYNLGTLCVIDSKPHKLSPEQRQALQVLSKQTVQLLELKWHTKRVEMLNRQKNLFMRILSHDIKNPFGIVRNYGRLLLKKLDQLPQDKIIESLTRMVTITEQCDNILNGVLNWSNQLESENGHVQYSASVHDAIQLAASLYKTQMEEKNIRFITNASTDMIVHAHQTALNSILQNCLYNAIKFSYPESKIEIKVSNTSEKMLIDCIDHGRGLDAEATQNLFNSERLGHSTPGTSNETGTGMGNKLIYDMVNDAGGSVTAQQTPGGGLTVSIELFRPLTPAKA